MWADRVADAADCDWTAPTPCREWTVRDLVNHVTGEDLWTAPLLRGETIERVGGRFDGDLLGSEPVSRALYAAGQASALVAEMLPGTERSTSPTARSRWRSTSTSSPRTTSSMPGTWPRQPAETRTSDSEAGSRGHQLVCGREDAYRSAGAVGPRIGTSGDPQHDLLAAFGRDAHWGPNHAGLARFSAAFSRGDIEAIMAHMTDDCVFEATGRHLRASATRVPRRSVRCGRRSSPPRGTPVSPRRTCSSPVNAVSCAGGSRGERGRLPRSRPRRRRPAAARRQGLREAVLRQG